MLKYLITFCLLFSIQMIVPAQSKQKKETPVDEDKLRQKAPAIRNVGIVSEIKKIKYPITKKAPIEDEYFNTTVVDPYRWLEDDKAKEVNAWVNSQNQVTNGYLSQIYYRADIKKRLTEMWNFERQTPFSKKDKYYFFTKNDGIQNQSVLYVQEGRTGKPRILLDPNKLSEDGTTSLTNYLASSNGKYLSYMVSKAGSDWEEIYLLDIETGKQLSDKIQWVKFSSIAWKGEGFYYSRYDAPKEGKSELSNKNEFHKIYYHKVGDDASNDKVIFKDNSFPLRNYTAQISDDENTLFIYGSEGTSGNNVKMLDLTKQSNLPFTIISDFSADYTVIDKINNKLLTLTNKNASNFKLVLIDPQNLEMDDWQKVIPESKNLLEGITLCGDKMLVKYLEDVVNHLYVYSMSGEKELEVKLPAIGKIEAINGDKRDSLAFISFVNFTNPSTTYQYNLNAKSLDLVFSPKMDFKSDNFETKQIFVQAQDGTQIPVFLTSKKGLKLDGKNPCLLYGYGGFQISLAPEFRIDRALLLERGFVYAVANIRGGNEYGEQWHSGGTKMNKQNVFNDFVAVADYLVQQKYTTNELLAIHGRSNGGLLIGAVMTQNPKLAKVALPVVGVLDMLRYHKFTIGWAWASDYGTSEESEAMFKYLKGYSPIHNVKDTEYPATMVVTADHDDRVVPAHSYKFISHLQAHQKGSNPVLIRIDQKSGHGSGKPVSKQIEEFADLWSFTMFNLGLGY